MTTLALLTAAAIVAAAIVWAAAAVVREFRRMRTETARRRTADLLTLFVPGLAAAAENPRLVLVWQPIARAARKLFPDEFLSLDHAMGAAFPFSEAQLQDAHARWTTEWLTWERAHDAEFRLKCATAERDLIAPGAGAVERARFDAVEREKLELYQRRYEEYIRVAKALQALIDAHR